ncbi:DUF2628 domain-containing protein [Rufibacter latericius]|uniref:DUF2628 domain-containing protein n=2 Tax=Rufibacter latericius TaxID=2487040 RepID=A0A3M9MIQ6_9BACT|nr:DUF2628 domain-containing protein [Rufibacter latericius]
MLPDAPEPTAEDQEDFYRAYFGTEADYYLNKLAQYQAGTKFTFNIAAFFFGLFWMLYRKMYLQALILVLILFVESFLLGQAVKYYGFSQTNAGLLNNFFTVAWSTAIGFLGNWLYLRQAQARVTRALQTEPNEQAAVNRLSVEGGFTLLPHILVAAIIMVSLVVYRFV